MSSRLVGLSAHLGSVGHEDGGGEVARHAGHHVDDGDSRRTGHLLQIAQEEKLDHHRQRQVEDTAETGQHGQRLCMAHCR